jgi:hypothetical protein
MKNRVLSQSATVLLTAALLQACGGGGGGDSTPAPVANTAPTNVSLVEVSSAGSTVVTASWLPATDDSTTAANLNYEIHASTDPNFVPSASTLKLKGANLASARIDGLLPSTQYTLKLVVLDKDGLKTVSNSLQVTTSSTPSEQVAGVTVKTMTAGQTLAMTDTSLTLAAGAPVPNVGEFVASAEGDGYLRKVVAVNVVDGKTVLTTEQAALNEVLQKAELSSSFKIKSVPVEVAATPTQAGLMRVNDVTQPDHANFDWGNTGFKLNTTTYKADTNTPSQALIQAGLESVSASPSFSISSQTKTFDDGFGTFSQVTVPNSVSIAERATGEFKAVLKILSDDTEGPFWDRKNVPLTVCESELVKVVNEKGESVAGLVKFGALESVQSQSASGSVRVAHQVIKVDANFEKASEKPYVAVFKARVDEARDGCKSPSKEDFEYNVDIYVTSANDFPQKETSPLSFGKEFKVDNSITFTIDPVIESEVRLDNNLGPDTLSYARLELKTAPLVHQVLTINASASAKLDQTKTLFTRKFTKVYLAGQVPVVMVGEYGVDVRVDGEVTGAMDATETIDLGFSELSYGLVYQNGQYTTISKRVPEYSFTVEGNAKAKANLKVSLVPRLTVKFYGIATGKAYVEPYGLAEAGMEGHIKAGISDAGDFGDADYQLTEAQLSVGLDAYLYADLSVFKKTLVSFPEGKNQNTPYRELYKLEMLPNTKIMALPTLSGALVSAPPRTENSRSLLIRAKAENLPNPLTFLPPPRGSKPWIEFTNWTMPKVVFDAPNTLDTNGYKLVASDTTAGDFWFTYTQTGKYILRLSGYSSLGAWARQYTEVVVELTDTDKDGMIDQWEEAFGVTDPAADDDNDGVKNLQEFLAGTNPKLADVEQAKVDTDADGMPDAWEWRYGLNPYSDADATQDPDGDKITNVNEYKAGTNPKLADANALLKVSNASPTVNMAVSFSLATVFDSVKSIVWKFGETVVTVVENLASAISQMFNTVGDVLVSATLKDDAGEVLTVSTTVNVKPLVCQNGQVEQNGRCVDVPTTMPTSSCSALVKSIAFTDDFSGSVVDTTKWTASAYEGITVSSGKMSLSSRANGYFPFIQTVMNPVPTSGDFSIYVKMKYNAFGGSGTGVQASPASNVFITSGGGSVFGVWSDNTGNPIAAMDLNEHEYEFCAVGSTLYKYRDGTLLEQSALPANWVRPETIWIGNPFDISNTNWSTFEVSKVEVRGLQALNGSFTVPANSETGVAFTSPSSTKPLQCSFTASGTWKWNVASAATTAIGIGLNATHQWLMPSESAMSLIASTGDNKYEYIGNSKVMSVAAGQSLHFMMNDGLSFFEDNSGSLTVTYTCSEIPQPTWTINPANGHQYAAVDCGTWTQCEAQAVALGAHLVSVNDAAENAWLVSTFTPTKNYWIGLTDKDQEGVWKWTSGEAFGYSNWYSGEPNDGGGVEDYVHMNFHYSNFYGANREDSTGTWNDSVHDITVPSVNGVTYNSSAMGIFEKSSSENYSVEWHYPNIGTLITGRQNNEVKVTVTANDDVEVVGFMNTPKFDVDIIGQRVKLFNFRSYSAYPNMTQFTSGTFNGLVLRAVNGAFSSATFALDINGDGDFVDEGDIAPTSSKITIGSDYIAANLSGVNLSPSIVMYIDFQPL